MSAWPVLHTMPPATDTGVAPWKWTRETYRRALKLGWFPAAQVTLKDGELYLDVGRASTPTPSLEQPGTILWRFTRERYHEAARAGIFHPGERTELVHGRVYKKVTQNPAHTLSLRA